MSGIRNISRMNEYANSNDIMPYTHVALFDYENATDDDISLKKNDYLIILDKSHQDWWLARNMRTNLMGYVPFNYITTIDDMQIKE